MKIACCLLNLYLPNSHSLKDKRQVIKSIKNTLGNHCNNSIAKLEHQNLWQRATHGITLISDNGQTSNQILTRFVRSVEEDFRVELLNTHIEFH